MKQPKYHLKAEKELTIFQFISEGPKGNVPKLIEFTETNLNGFYNLAFGDRDEISGKLDDNWYEFENGVNYEGFVAKRKNA